VSLVFANLPRAGILLAACLIAFGWMEERRRAEPAAAVAFEASAAARICAEEKYPESYFWERARTMGVRIALLRSESVAGFLETGKAIRFTAEEIEKMRAAGAAAAEAPLSPESIWTDDPEIARRFKRGAEAANTPIEIQTFRGRSILSLPWESSVTAGFDLQRAAALRALGLTPGYAIRSRVDLLLALDDPEPAVYWVEGGWLEWDFETVEDLHRRLEESESWIVWSKEWIPPYRTPAAARRRAEKTRRHRIDSLRAARARLGGTLAAAVGPRGAVTAARTGDFLLFALGSEKGVEGNLLIWRDRFNALRRAGIGAGPARLAAPEPPAGEVERAARRMIGAAVLVLGPLLAFAAGRKTMELRKRPELAYAAAVGCALLAGLIGRSGVSLFDIRLSMSYPIGAFAVSAPGEDLVYWLGAWWPLTVLGCGALWIALRRSLTLQGKASSLWIVAGVLGLIGIVQGIMDSRIMLKISIYQSLLGILVGGVTGGLILAGSRLIFRDGPVVQ